MAGNNRNHRQVSPTSSIHRRRGLFEIVMVIIFVALAIELVIPVYAQYSKLTGDTPSESKTTQSNPDASVDLFKGKACPHKKCTLTPTITLTRSSTPTAHPPVGSTPTPTVTATNTVTPTYSATASVTPTSTGTPSLTPTLTVTPGSW
jgi:hypothetical protein